MRKSIVGAMALSALMSGVRAAAESAGTEPLLRVSQLSGTLEVETPNRKESVAGQKLPYLRPGSIVRVRSGAAAFRTDLRASVRAGKGDAFHFDAAKPEGGRPGSVRIAAVGADPKTIEVAVGGEKFLVNRGGVLLLSATAPGELTVLAEAGEVRLSPGVGTKGRALAAGEKLIVPVESDEPGRGLNLAELSVTRKNETTYTAVSDGHTPNAVAAWPQPSKAVAQALIGKYGPPDAADAEQLSWNENGGWKRTTVYRAPRAEAEILEQSVRYAVPAAKREALNGLGLALNVSPIDGELTATGDSEAKNFLAINVADEVVRGERAPEDAREFYRKTVELSEAGKSSAYMRELRLKP